MQMIYSQIFGKIKPLLKKIYPQSFADAKLNTGMLKQGKWEGKERGQKSLQSGSCGRAIRVWTQW
jgi:hypothetical protein